MQPANQQKAIVIVAIVAVVALVATTFFSNSGLIYNLSDEEKQAIEQHQEAVRNSVRFAAESGVDEEASRIFWEQTLDEKQIASEVNAELGFNSSYSLPELDTERLNVSNDVSGEAYEAYAAKMYDILSTYQFETEQLLPVSWGYGADPSAAYKLAQSTKELVEELYSVEVPSTAVRIHEKTLLGMLAQNTYVGDNDLYIRGLLPRGTQWSGTAGAFAAFQESVRGVESEAQKLASLYGYLADSGESSGKDGLFKPKEAQAFIGTPIPGGGVPVTTTFDWPRFIREVLEASVALSVTNFVKSTVMAYIQNTEKQLMVTNYLHYTDALVNVKYADTFLEKYVEKPQDRDIIKKLLPQFSCGKVDEKQLRDELRNKALDYLGFDPKKLDPTDPSFYDKLLKASNPDNASAAISEEGAILFNWSLAVVTESKAQTAVSQELLAPGKKVPVLNDKQKSIAVSLDYVTSKLNAAIKSVFDLVLPTSSTKGYGSLAAVAVSAVTSIITQFGFSNLVVVKEQQVCVKAPVFNPIVPPNAGSVDINIDQKDIKACIENPNSCPLILSFSRGGEYSV